MSVKDAKDIAVKYFHELFAGYNYSDVRLEEMEKFGEDWMITLGYLDPTQEGYSLGIIRRKYKVFTINGVTKEVTSVKIRNVE